MKRDLALAEWRLAGESCRAAEILVREGCYRDAISRTYYAVVHAAKAALYVHDVNARSHTALRRLFGLHLIRTRQIEKEWALLLSEGLDERPAADYDAETTFSEHDARRQCRDVRKSVRRIREYLLQNGISESELRKRKP